MQCVGLEAVTRRMETACRRGRSDRPHRGDGRIVDRRFILLFAVYTGKRRLHEDGIIPDWELQDGLYTIHYYAPQHTDLMRLRLLVDGAKCVIKVGFHQSQ